uniref:Uncharacterized protein n=1 Tax=Anguilla anguilla TaxID=7936 RepID=A0A0E9QVZ3_ANGAN
MFSLWLIVTYIEGILNTHTHTHTHPILK